MNKGQIELIRIMKSWTPTQIWTESAETVLQRERRRRSALRWLIAGLLAFLAGWALIWATA